MDNVHFVITGIGINVNIEEFPEELQQTATSLKIEKRTNYFQKKYYKSSIEEFEKIYLQYEKSVVSYLFAKNIKILYQYR